MFDVITIGSATRDVFIQSKDFLTKTSFLKKRGKFISLPLGAKIELQDIEFTTGGGATNTAVSFARKGLKVGIICRVADDANGRAVLEELEREGVDVELAQISSRMHTAYSVILLTPEGARTILVYRGTSGDIAESAVVWEKVKARWAYLSSVGGDTSFLREFFRAAKRHQILVAFNPGSRELSLPRKEILPYLKASQVLFFNLEEAKSLFSLPISKLSELWKKLRILFPKSCIVVTQGREGAFVLERDFLFRAKTFKEKKLMDRTGAGDAFGSGFVYGIIDKLKERGISLSPENFVLEADEVKHALRIGSANATSVIENLGTKKGLLGKKELSLSRWKELKITTKKIT